MAKNIFLLHKINILSPKLYFSLLKALSILFASFFFVGENFFSSSRWHGPEMIFNLIKWNKMKWNGNYLIIKQLQMNRVFLANLTSPSILCKQFLAVKANCLLKWADSIWKGTSNDIKQDESTDISSWNSKESLSKWAYQLFNN